MRAVGEGKREDKRADAPREGMGEENVFMAVRYSFDMPVLYEYVRSGFEDFEDFIDAISFDTSDD